MLWRTSEIIGYGIRATDGSIGSISDLLFDDISWTLRWAVIDTGTWLPGRQVLLPPSALGRPDSTSREFPVDLTRDRVKDSPSIERDAPVSRQMEADIYGYYGWTPYWTAGYAYPGYIPAPGAAPGAVPATAAGYPRPGEGGAPGEPEGDPHLRSVSEVTGYYVRATDEDIGHIEEFLIEEDSWVLRYLVVDTKNWWPGKLVLVSPQWVVDVRWNEQQVAIDLTREQVKNSPEYNPIAPVDRAYEERLYDHYGYPRYWE